MEGVYKMKTLCLYRLVKSSDKGIIKDYIKTRYPIRYQWKFNDKRLIWHIKNDSILREWAIEKGVKI